MAKSGCCDLDFEGPGHVPVCPDAPLDLPAMMDALLFPDKETPVPIEVANQDRYCTECKDLASQQPRFIQGYPVKVAVDCGNHQWRLRAHDRWLEAGQTQIFKCLIALGYDYIWPGNLTVFQEEDGTISGFSFPARGLTFRQLDRISGLFGTKRINWTKRDGDATAYYSDLGNVEVLAPVLAAAG